MRTCIALKDTLRSSGLLGNLLGYSTLCSFSIYITDMGPNRKRVHCVTQCHMKPEEGGRIPTASHEPSPTAWKTG